ncbi:MAG: DUF3365 domain-containing protein [Bacteroidia bacterium]|nr:DUF3365 domain-containing protein [Bacteroidia bacterium]
MKQLIALFFVFAVAACKHGTTNTLSPEQEQTLLKTGDSIAVSVQALLQQNVAKAMQAGGPVYAVAFCNEKAAFLTDSMSTLHGTFIQRLSDKNRNPANEIKDTADHTAWKKLSTKQEAFVQTDAHGKRYFYKPITISMPACLKCHGGRADIQDSTRKVILGKYPYDKAVDYQMGDLRGMWKIGVGS